MVLKSKLIAINKCINTRDRLKLNKLNFQIRKSKNKNEFKNSRKKEVKKNFLKYKIINKIQLVL